MSRLSFAFVGVAFAAVVALTLLQAQFLAGPAGLPMSSGMAHSGVAATAAGHSGH